MIRLKRMRGSLCGMREWVQFLHGGPKGSQKSVMIHESQICPDCNTPGGIVDDEFCPTWLVLIHDSTCPSRGRPIPVEPGIGRAITEKYFREELVANKARA